MPKTVALITEYNPFHLGHLYHAEMAKKLTGADHSLAIMSGNFTERGSLSMADKSSRAAAAVSSAVDVVIELPFAFATGSAEDFSYGAIKILNSLNSIDYLVFGAECDDLYKMEKLSDYLTNEKAEYKDHFNASLLQGLSFPAAREAAVRKLLGDEYADILKSPNNILAISYMISLKKSNSSIRPVIIKRMGNYHFNADEDKNAQFPSAEMIRRKISLNEDVKDLLPLASYNCLLPYLKNEIKDDFLSDLLYLKILELKKQSRINNFEEIKNSLPVEIDKDIYNKILSIREFSDLNSCIEELVSKNYTYARIRRGLLHLILSFDRDKHDLIFNEHFLYATLLAFRKDKSSLLRIIQEQTSIPLINKRANFKTDNKGVLISRQLDITASDLYKYLIYKNCKIKIKNEITQSPIII